jgi:hypothetical protein
MDGSENRGGTLKGCQRIPAKPVLAPVVAQKRTGPSSERLHGRRPCYGRLA